VQGAPTKTWYGQGVLIKYFAGCAEESIWYCVGCAAGSSVVDAKLL
jgi:hypothetical protein